MGEKNHLFKGFTTTAFKGLTDNKHYEPYLNTDSNFYNC